MNWTNPLTALADVRIVTTLISYFVGLYAVTNVLYSVGLLLAAMVGRWRYRFAGPVATPQTKFCIMVPAHDEELVIFKTLNSLCSLDYPIDLYDIVLIADNCSDRTAEIAAQMDRVIVLRRENKLERGKGFALNWAFDQVKESLSFDNVVIVDADTQVDSQFLRQMDRRRSESGQKYFAAQGRYDVVNPNDSWRTALMAGALSLVHVVRPLARELLGLSVGLKGNGMSFDVCVFEALAWRGNSLTEDIDFSLDLLEKLDVRVLFAPHARVAALMPTSVGGAASQRLRWEEGRSSVSRSRIYKLLFDGFATFRLTKIDAAIDLLSPPLAQLAGAIAVWIITIVALAMLGAPWKLDALFAAGSLFGLGVYVLGGFLVGGAPQSAFISLAYAPFYIVWKLLLRVLRVPTKSPEWVRTAREERLEDRLVIDAAPVATAQPAQSDFEQESVELNK